MTTQHTQGRLKVQHPHSGERGWEVAFEPGLEQVCQNVTEKNARRLAACWNATVGIPTEMLEAASNAEKVEPTWQDLKDQRDTLEHALSGLLAYFDSGNCVPVDKATIRSDCAEVVAARAAIVKAEGGTA